MGPLPRNLEQLIGDVFAASTHEDGWMPLAAAGQQLRKMDPSFSPQKYGYARLLDLLKDADHLIELQKDASFTPPAYYGRRHVGPAVRGEPQRSRSPKKVAVSSSAPIPIWQYVNVDTTHDPLRKLAARALPEDWAFSGGESSAARYPILENYLTYTFMRLQRESKVAISVDGRFSAFNTGLVDTRYEPIYTLLAKNDRGPQPWYHVDFCIAGEGREGKQLVSSFKDLPKPAHYFVKPEEMFYDLLAGPPHVDWDHIITDNIDRLPESFLEEHCPDGFTIRDAQAMERNERNEYNASFVQSLKRDASTWRALHRRCKDALEIAMRRVQWNFKTAIPFYYPRHDKMSLLLPLGLASDEHVDIALACGKEPSGNYLARTILPLEWAYMNARLVCRPDSDWLRARTIVPSCKEIVDEAIDDAD